MFPVEESNSPVTEIHIDESEDASYTGDFTQASNSIVSVNEMKSESGDIPTSRSSSVASSSQKAVPRKKQCCYGSHVLNISKDPNVIKLPRIPKEDIRRKYPMMLMNILNGMDFTKIYDFLAKFTHPQTLLKRQVMSPHNPNLEIQSMSFYGKDEIFRFMYTLGLLGPDRVFQLNDCCIVTRSTTFRSEIVLDCTIHVNYMFHADLGNVSQFLQVFHQLQYDKLKEKVDPQQLDEMEKAFRRTYPMLIQPLSKVINRKIILVIDNVYEKEELDAIYLRISSPQTIFE